jgi:protein-disulfide isomerase
LARFRDISLNIVVLFIFMGAGCKAQTAGASGSLSPEVAHRIQVELRARYGVPQHIKLVLAEPRPSELNGYDTLDVTFTGGTKPTTLEFLLSKDRKTIAHLEKMDISQDLMSKIDVKGRPIRGKTDAKVTIVNFDDFQCPYCAQMHSILFPGLLAQYGDRVRFVYRDFPLVEIHPWAMHAAVDANCLADQSTDAYWSFADYVHSSQNAFRGKALLENLLALDQATKDQGAKYKVDATKLDACVKKQDESAVRTSMAEGDKLGVDSTPTMYINGEKVSGIVPMDQLHAILDRALADAGQAAPAAAPKAEAQKH